MMMFTFRFFIRSGFYLIHSNFKADNYNTIEMTCQELEIKV